MRTFSSMFKPGPNAMITSGGTRSATCTGGKCANPGGGGSLSCHAYTACGAWNISGYVAYGGTTSTDSPGFTFAWIHSATGVNGSGTGLTSSRAYAYGVERSGASVSGEKFSRLLPNATHAITAVSASDRRASGSSVNTPTAMQRGMRKLK